MLLERLGKELLYFDGGMGTLLQSKGLQPGELPEVWNLEHAEEIVDIHKSYFEAGSDIVLSNTFGANAIKFHDSKYGLERNRDGRDTKMTKRPQSSACMMEERLM